MGAATTPSVSEQGIVPSTTDTLAERTENDAFGAVKIPSTRYWGAQTQRAVSVFRVGQEKFPSSLFNAFALQKLSAARANAKLGRLDPVIAEAIVVAAKEVEAGNFDEHFPLPVWQTGSGTQTNMNVNEVIANRANQLLGQPLGTKSPVHPNDHVNCSQSSNDSFPTTMHVAVVLELRRQLIPALEALHNTLRVKAGEFQHMIKIGRTHVMDAVPMTMGQTFDAFAWQVKHNIDRILSLFPLLHEIPQGGTAVGTGLNAPRDFDAVFCEKLNELTGECFVPAASKFESMGSHDTLVAVSGALNVLATSLLKMATDIRLLGSGPRCGLGELIIPHDGLTSSIMPGKRNATLAEMIMQVAFRVMGNHTTVSVAGASGTFELNVAKPVIIYSLLQSITILTEGISSFSSGLIKDLEVNEDTLRRNVSDSLLSATCLNPTLGYEKVSVIVSKAMQDNISPKAAAVSLGFLSEEEYDSLVDPAAMAEPFRAEELS